MERFTKPRPLNKDEFPREETNADFEAARMRVHATLADVEKRARALTPEVRQHNEEVDRQIDARLSEDAAKARKEHRGIRTEAWKETAGWVSRREREAGYRNAYKEVYYQALQEVYQLTLPNGHVICINPYIDSTTYQTWQGESLAYLYPGSGIYIWGVCFGPPQGRVLMQVTPSGDVVDLEVAEWSDTCVRARLSPFICGLREYDDGRFWIVTGKGRSSNWLVAKFLPWSTIWQATKRISQDGGLFGGSKDGTFLSGVWIEDTAFTVQVTSEHIGDGWSALRSPNAYGQSLAQGYHIGVGAFGSATIELNYWLSGPKCVNPPQVSGLPAWVYCTDNQPDPGVWVY
jgi:hypothetical protein